MNNIYQGPESYDLKDAYRFPGAGGVCIHFSYAGQREMSNRWFASINATFNQVGNTSRYVDLTNRSGNYQCRIGELCISRTGGQNITTYLPNGSVALIQKCNGPWVLDFSAGHYTNLCSGLTTTVPTLNQPNHWQDAGVIRLVSRTKAQNRFITNFDLEVWGAASYRKADDVYLHNSSGFGNVFPMGNYYLKIIKAIDTRQTLYFTPTVVQ